MRILIFISFILFFTSIIGLFQVKAHVQDMNKLLIKIQKDINEASDEVNLLKAEWSYLNRPDRLEKLARKYLNYSNDNIILAKRIYSDIESLKRSESMVAQNISNR